MLDPARRSAAAVAVVLLLVSGCNDDAGNDQPGTEPTEEPEAAGSPVTGADGALPPVDVTELRTTYADELAELGFELTERGGLIDRSDGYENSEAGDHLALYVSPLAPRSDDDYLDGIVEVTAVFADVFERWPGLATFDVCQERHRDDPLVDRQLTVTQVELTEETTAAVDWDTADLGDVFLAVEADADSYVRAFGEVSRHERFVGARTAAREELGDDAVSSFGN